MIARRAIDSEQWPGSYCILQFQEETRQSGRKIEKTAHTPSGFGAFTLIIQPGGRGLDKLWD